jgi:hypothetical protein
VIVRRATLFVVTLGTILLAIGIAPRRAHAQMTTAETLTEAARLYDALEVERAVLLLRRVISPSTPFEVSKEQRVQAYTYLGASLAILGMRDSATTYFRAALERDPFVDLDPARFTQRERDAFADARQRTLAVAARPIVARFLDPRTDSMVFTVVSTQQTQLHVDVRGLLGDSTVVVLLDRESEGVRELPWNGRLADGRLVSPGRYALFLRARSASGASDSARLLFEIAHDHPPLEDSIPTPNGAALLPERYPASAGARDMARGIGLAGIALAIPALGNRHLGANGRGYARGAAVGALAAGAAAYFIRRSHPINNANVAENARRRADVAARNAEIERRNADRVAGMRLLVTPAGAAP